MRCLSFRDGLISLSARSSRVPHILTRVGAPSSFRAEWHSAVCAESVSWVHPSVTLGLRPPFGGREE